jgi:hypothetical protein
MPLLTNEVAAGPEAVAEIAVADAIVDVAVLQFAARDSTGMYILYITAPYQV